MKHGLCASKLALPTENPEALKAEYRHWIDTYQPRGPTELHLVEDAARSPHIKINRCERHQSGRPRRAGPQRPNPLVRGAGRPPRRRARAPQERPQLARPRTQTLRHGGDGGCSRGTDEAGRLVPRGEGTCPISDYVDEAIRLLGAHPKKTRSGPLEAYQFQLFHAAGAGASTRRSWLACCRPAAGIPIMSRVGALIVPTPSGVARKSRSWCATRSRTWRTPSVCSGRSNDSIARAGAHSTAEECLPTRTIRDWPCSTRDAGAVGLAQGGQGAGPAANGASEGRIGSETKRSQ